MSVWLCAMSFTWICFLLLDLCSMIPKIAWLQGWLFKYVLWQNENWGIDSFNTTVKKRRDWQKIKQQCDRYCVFSVCCKLQMAAFQFHDGNSTLAFTAVCSLTLWAGYLHEAKLSQTTVSPNHWTSRILYNKSWLNWINVLLLLAFSSLTLFTKVKVQMKGSAK